MSSFDAGTWAAADPDAPLESKDPPDPGVYDVVIADARAFQSKAGKDTLIVEWNITAGPQTGYQWPDIYGFKSEGQTKAAKGLCSRIGVDVEGIAGLGDLDAAVKTRVGEYFTVEVRQNGDYRNTYVQASSQPALVSDVPNDAFQPAAAASAGDADDEPLPF